MIATDLNSKWEKITIDEDLTDYRSIRISSECCSDIYISIDPNRCHCLILSLPKTYQIDFNSIKKEKISIELLRDKNYIVLTLHDANYHDLFDILIISLYNAIKDIQEVSIYSKIFVNTFHKWAQFFDDELLDSLSKNIVQGIFGELAYLKSLLLKTTASKVNDVLNAWKGPYDQGHDFVLNDKDIEVKTKADGKSTIRISSEQQLERIDGRDLELAVVSVHFDLVDGVPIKILVEDIKQIVENFLGDTSILLKAMRQKGLTVTNLQNYDHWRFKALDIITYDCLNSSFPKIVSSEIPTPISGVKYNINLRDLDGYITIEETF
jgi:hypothetical protein